MLGRGLGDLLENRLQQIQIRKHTRQALKAGSLDKVIFTPDICKGHYDGHRHNTLTAYNKQLKEHTSSRSVNGVH